MKDTSKIDNESAKAIEEMLNSIWVELFSLDLSKPDLIGSALFVDFLKSDLSTLKIDSKRIGRCEKLSNFASNVGLGLDTVKLVCDIIETGGSTYTDIVCLVTLVANYSQVIEDLTIMMNNAQTSEMRNVYKKVLSEIKSYNEKNIPKIVKSAIGKHKYEYLDIIGNSVVLAYDAVTGLVLKINLVVSEGKTIPYGIMLYRFLSGFVDLMYTGSGLYHAVDQVVAASDSIDWIESDVQYYLSKYKNNPTDKNKIDLIQVARALVELKLKALSACRDVIYNQNMYNIIDMITTGWKSVEEFESYVFDDETFILDQVRIINSSAES